MSYRAVARRSKIRVDDGRRCDCNKSAVREESGDVAEGGVEFEVVAEEEAVGAGRSCTRRRSPVTPMPFVQTFRVRRGACEHGPRATTDHLHLRPLEILTGDAENIR